MVVVVRWRVKGCKQSDRQTCFCRQAMGERSTSGDCSSATLLILAGCNLAWKVWPGKHGRGSWEREGETECWEDTDKACSKMKRGKRIWFRSVLEMCVCVCARVPKCRTVCEWKTETSPGYGGCTETCHQSPAVLEAQMEVCLWHVHMHACVCTYAQSHTNRDCRVCRHICIDRHILSPSSHLSE